jgi:hypothetical protein
VEERFPGVLGETVFEGRVDQKGVGEKVLDIVWRVTFVVVCNGLGSNIIRTLENNQFANGKEMPIGESSFFLVPSPYGLSVCYAWGECRNERFRRMPFSS